MIASLWRRAGERGQALVEFALAAIVFMALLFGMIDLGRAVWHYNTLAQATREGTRYAIVHGADSSAPTGPGNEAAIVEVVESHATGLGSSGLSVDAAWPDGSNLAGSRVTVTSDYDFEPLLDFWGALSFNMSSSSTMVITN